MMQRRVQQSKASRIGFAAGTAKQIVPKLAEHLIENPPEPPLRTPSLRAVGGRYALNPRGIGINRNPHLPAWPLQERHVRREIGPPLLFIRFLQASLPQPGFPRLPLCINRVAHRLRPPNQVLGGCLVYRLLA